MIIRKKSSDCLTLLTLMLMLSCTGLSAVAKSAAPTDSQPVWESPLHQDHPLTGKIWLTAAQRFITRNELLSQLQQSPVLLLGEKHDNPDHHRLRLSLLDSLLSPGKKSLIALEMMERRQQTHIDALATNYQDLQAAQLADHLAWDEQGWPWQFYGPAVTLSLQRGASLAAGNIDSADVMAIYRDATPTAPQLLDTQQLAQLERDIDSSHCGLLPAEQFPAMVRVQQARDQKMADVLMSGRNTFDQRILLAGNYHIRRDLGVPNYLPGPMSRQSVSVAFLEVDPESDEPTAYLQQFSDVAAYDVIWFTPALRQDDYCADMRAAQNP